MSDPSGFGGGDFLRNMLSDLLRLLPTTGGMQWQLAHQLATEIAGTGSDPNPDPLERIQLEQLTAIAELHVADVTGMPTAPAGGSLSIVPSSRRQWARSTLEVWKPVLDRLAESLGPAAPGVPAPGGPPTAPGSDLDLAPDTGGEGDMGSLLGQWATAIFPMMTAMQVGSVVGHLAERALGPYEVPLAPVRSGELLVISRNLAQVAEDWSLPIDDLRLWICVHELAYHTVMTRPAVAERMAALVVQHAEQVRPDAAAISELMQSADVNDPSALMRIFADPAALGSGTEDGPSAVRAELDALTAAVAGYAEHVTGTVADRLIGQHAPIGEAMRRRRVGRGDGEKVAEALFGLCLDQALVDRGEKFVRGVLERSGDAWLARMWVGPETLPTPAEIDAPGLWLARLELFEES